MFVFVIINGSKHVQTYGYSRDQDFTRLCSYTNRVGWANYISSGCKFPIVYNCICAKNYENWMTVGKVLPFGARGSRNYAPPCSFRPGKVHLEIPSESFPARASDHGGIWKSFVNR